MESGRIKIFHKQKKGVGKMNPSEAETNIYYNALKSYDKAQENIEEYGEIVTHPKTGAPIENPYLKVRDMAAKQMLSFKKQYPRFKDF